VIRITKSEPAVDDILGDKAERIASTGSDEQDREAASAAAANIKAHGMTVTSMASATGHQDTMYPHANTQTILQSETADNIVWTTYAKPSQATQPQPPRVMDALGRMEFLEISTPTPLQAAVDHTTSQSQTAIEHEKNLIVVLGRSRRLATEDHSQELKGLTEKNGRIGGEVKRTIGDVATALVVSGCGAGLVVLQAATRSLD